MILSGQATREEALRTLEEPLYQDEELHRDRDYVALKLGISVDELESYIRAPKRYYYEYPNWEGRYNALKAFQTMIQHMFGRRVKGYS
jgi:hypothetical protein